MPIRKEVPPAWRFNWAAARPPLFIIRIVDPCLSGCGHAFGAAELESGRL